MRSPRTTTKSSPRSPQLEKALVQQRRPNAAKNFKKKEKRKNQALFLEGSEISVKPCTTLNHDTLLPSPNPNTPLLHSCLEVVDHAYSARAALQDTPLPNPDAEWCTDSSPFI